MADDDLDHIAACRAEIENQGGTPMENVLLRSAENLAARLKIAETDPPMAVYYRAKLKLAAFRALEGWGTTVPNAGNTGTTFKSWPISVRQKEADKLLAWMLGGEPDDARS